MAPFRAHSSSIRGRAPPGWATCFLCSSFYSHRQGGKGCSILEDSMTIVPSLLGPSAPRTYLLGVCATRLLHGLHSTLLTSPRHSHKAAPLSYSVLNHLTELRVPGASHGQLFSLHLVQASVPGFWMHHLLGMNVQRPHRVHLLHLRVTLMPAMSPCTVSATPGPSVLHSKHTRG